jgi:hypothetical protein
MHSHMYMWWKQSIETFIRMKWDWQTDTMYITWTFLDLFVLEKGACMTVVHWYTCFFMENVMKIVTGAYTCMYIVSVCQSHFIRMKVSIDCFHHIYMWECIHGKQVYQCTTVMHAPFSKTNKSKKVQVINEWKLGLTFYSVISIN